MDFNRICTHCMKVEEVNGVCAHCGLPIGVKNPVTHQLPALSILAGKYLVGDVIGEGGFGITYIGLELNMNRVVAIKEFYPDGYCIRNSYETTNIRIYGGPAEKTVKTWRDNFIGEAQILSKCTMLPGVVHVMDFFKENETAYIIMEYLEGINLDVYVDKRGGRIPAQMFISAIEPVLRALEEIHTQGLVHRDLSPDNIRLLDDGRMKIMDFGAAKDLSVTDAGEKNQAITLKKGYAPVEQYSTESEVGPWLDVYAIAATIYKCITGVILPEATDREKSDGLVPPSRLTAGITQEIEGALLKALAIRREDRFQNVGEFRNALYRNFNGPVGVPLVYMQAGVYSQPQGGMNPPPKTSQPPKKLKQKNDFWAYMGVGIAVALILMSLMSSLMKLRNHRQWNRRNGINGLHVEKQDEIHVERVDDY